MSGNSFHYYDILLPNICILILGVSGANSFTELAKGVGEVFVYEFCMRSSRSKAGIQAIIGLELSGITLRRTNFQGANQLSLLPTGWCATSFFT
jgi:hypothetical protein